MSTIAERIREIRKRVPEGVCLVCVSKFHPAEAVMEAYDAGERDFGESRVQELVAKEKVLPKDIRWHFIGHLQTNKVRQIIGFVDLIQSVDSLRLLEVIEKEAERIGRVVRVLLEVHVAREETKSGFGKEELEAVWAKLKEFRHIEVAGLMTMATNTEDEQEIHRCFREAAKIAREHLGEGSVLSMGMSNDFELAIADGANMIRIGTDIFGTRKSIKGH